MSIFEAALLCGLVVAALVNWGNLRAQAWLSIGAADYMLTSAYYHLGLPLHPFVTAMTDATVCLLIYRFGRVKWELALYLAFQFSVLVSFVKVAGLASDESYALLLEIANWLAILAILGTGSMRLADAWNDIGGAHTDRSGLHRLVSALYAPAKIDPWWWARGWLPLAR